MNADGSDSLPASEVALTHAFSAKRVGMHRAAAAGTGYEMLRTQCSFLGPGAPDIPL